MANDRVQVYDNSDRDYISIERLWLFSNKDNKISKKTITGCFWINCWICSATDNSSIIERK